MPCVSNLRQKDLLSSECSRTRPFAVISTKQPYVPANEPYISATESFRLATSTSGLDVGVCERTCMCALRQNCCVSADSGRECRY